MKFSCSRDALTGALNIASRGVSARSTMPVLEGILFNVYDGMLHLTATDLEIGVTTQIPVDVQEDGAAVLSASLIVEIVKKLPGGTVTFESARDARVKIQNMKSQFSLSGLPVADFPAFPSADEAFSLQVDAGVLRRMVQATGFSAATSENIPILTGIKIEAEGEALKTIAIDGYRLALRRGQLAAAVHEPVSVVVPSKSMNELVRLLQNTDGTIQVDFSKSQIFFSAEDTVFTSRLLEGEFINYAGVIPKESTTTLYIDRAQLLDSCERAALLARTGKNIPVKMQVEDDVLTITAGADIGDVHEEILTEHTGNDLRIAFNSRFFIDALRAIEEERIKIGMTTPVGPAVIEPVDGDSYTYLILPVRLAEDE